MKVNCTFFFFPHLGKKKEEICQGTILSMQNLSYGPQTKAGKTSLMGLPPSHPPPRHPDHFKARNQRIFPIPGLARNREGKREGEKKRKTCLRESSSRPSDTSAGERSRQLSPTRPRTPGLQPQGERLHPPRMRGEGCQEVVPTRQVNSTGDVATAHLRCPSFLCCLCAAPAPEVTG